MSVFPDSDDAAEQYARTLGHPPTINVKDLPAMYRIVRILKTPASLKDIIALEIIPVEDDGGGDPQHMLVCVPIGSPPLKKGSWVYLTEVRFGNCTIYRIR